MALRTLAVGGARTDANRTRASSDDLRYSLRISVWVRWFVVAAWLAQNNYRPDIGSDTYLPNTLLAVSLLCVNGLVHYLIHTGRRLTWHFALLLSAMDIATITAGLVLSGGFANEFYVLYYPAVAAFAVVFTSFRASFAWVTLVAATYTSVSLVTEPGIDFSQQMERVLFMRLVTMYAVVIAVNLITGLERVRRRQAVARERELQTERMELSQTIHDTIAQSAYMIGLGLETAIELAAGGSRELIERLRATHALSTSTMWELRHPIDVGPLFEGRSLSRVLRSHAATFTTITSIPTEMNLSGQEPDLSTSTKRLLFSIAHNALTNAHRHSGAGLVRVSLEFQSDRLCMAIADDGVGLPDDYQERGHGFRGMRSDAHRIGGQIQVSSAESGCGTVVSCTVPIGGEEGEL